MRIDINFQSLAQKLKYKAISNYLRKGKTNSTRGPSPHGRAHHGAGHDPVTRARCQLCKNAPTLKLNQPVVHNTISRERDYADRTLQSIAFTTARSLATPTCAGAADVALDGHASQPGPAPTQIAGQSAPTALAPTLAKATVATELAGVTTMVSGRM